ncbi:MAG: hypothetical protein ACQEQA_05715 [Bacillota bacterium]
MQKKIDGGIDEAPNRNQNEKAMPQQIRMPNQSGVYVRFVSVIIKMKE